MASFHRICNVFFYASGQNEGCMLQFKTLLCEGLTNLNKLREK